MPSKCSKAKKPSAVVSRPYHNPMMTKVIHKTLAHISAVAAESRQRRETGKKPSRKKR